jgi:hypothetical protein
VTIVGELVATGMPEHVSMRLDADTPRRSARDKSRRTAQNSMCVSAVRVQR